MSKVRGARNESGRRQRASVPLIPDNLLREAAHYADEHDAPLLRRLRTPLQEEGVIVAWKGDDYHYYQLVVRESIDGICPRHVHLEWVRHHLEQENVPEQIVRALGHGRVESILKVAVKMRNGTRGLSDRTYARVYGGPYRGTLRRIERWLRQTVDIYSLDQTGDESLFSFLESHSPAHAALLGLLAKVQPTIPWLNPDTGEEIGTIDTDAYDPSTQVVIGAAGLTCLQWAADLLGANLRFEVRYS